MAMTGMPSFDFNVWLSMPSVVEAWKGTNLAYDHREALHLAAMLKLLRRQAARGQGGEWAPELAREVVGLALSCALPHPATEYLDGDFRLAPKLRGLVLRDSMAVASQAIGDLNSTVGGSASDLLMQASKMAA